MSDVTDDLNERALLWADHSHPGKTAKLLRELVKARRDQSALLIERDGEIERLQKEHRRLAGEWADRIEKQLPCIEAAEAECARLREALDVLVKDCPDCGGEGTVYLMEDEREICQPPGSSGQDCRRCAQARQALAGQPDSLNLEISPETQAEIEQLEEQQRLGPVRAREIERQIAIGQPDSVAEAERGEGAEDDIDLPGLLAKERERCSKIASDHGTFCRREADGGGDPVLYERAEGAFHIAATIVEQGDG